MADNIIMPGVAVADDPWNTPSDEPLFPDAFSDEGTITPQLKPTKVSEPVADLRAKKYDYALGENSPGQDVLKYDVLSGEEENRRSFALQQKALQDQNLKIDLLREYVQQEGPNADPDVARNILNAPADDLKDPATFYEKQYARKFMSDTAVLDADPTDIDGIVIDNSALSEADPEDAHAILDASELIKANQESDAKILEDLQAEGQEMGWGETIYYHGKALIPFTSWANLSGAVESAPTVSFLLGNNMEEQYEYLNSISDVDERRALVLRAIEELKASNPLDAMVFASGLVSYSQSDKFLNNAVSVLDLSIPLPGVGVGTVAGYRALGKGAVNTAGKLASVSKAAIALGPRATAAQVMSATGNLGKAGLMQTIAKLSKRAETTVGSRGGINYTQMVDELPSLTNPATITSAAGHLSREAAQRIEDTLIENSRVLFNMTYEEAIKGGRLNGEVLQAALDDVKDLMNVSYGGKSNIVIDVNPIDVTEGIGQAQYARVTVGRKDAELFDSAEEAINVNKNFYGFKNAKVRTVGGKYALEVHVPVDETAVTVRDALKRITTEKEGTQKSLANLFIPFLRSSKDRWEKTIAQEADSAMMGGSQLVHVAKQILAPVGKLSTKDYDDLDIFMGWQRDYKASKGAERGKFSDTIAELEQDWMQVHHSLPSEKIVNAYFAARQINDFGWTVTNFGLFRDKSRKGLQQFAFSKGGAPNIEGKLVRPDTLWENAENAGIVIMDDIDPANVRPTYKNWLNKETEKEIRDKLASGEYKLVQLSTFGKQAFRELYKDTEINIGAADFVISKNVRSAPLDFKQLPYKPGGHVELDDGFFISQANIARRTDNHTKAQVSTYFGDRNLYHFVSEKDAHEIVKNLEYARQLLYKATVSDKANKGLHLTALNNYLKTKAGLPHSYKEFNKMFRGKDALYKIDEPFRVRRKNESLGSKYALDKDPRNAGWINERDSHWNLYKGGVNLEWGGERGDHIYTIMNKGSTVNPSYKLDPAKHINALTTLNRATNAAMRGVFVDDFKHVASERFVAEFGDLLDGSEELLRANPYKALVDGNFKKGIDTDLRLSAAKASRRATLEFLGSKTPEGRAMDVVKAKLWQKLLERKGTDGAYATMNTLNKFDGWAFGAIKDPVSFMRSLAFHQKLGLFNPAQLFLQMQTMTHVLAVGGPIHGLKGWEGAIHHVRAMLNPDHFDFLATKITSWDKNELRESWDWANKTGWYRVGREVAVRSDFLEENLFARGFTGAVSNFGEKATLFFREGERITRMAAWNAAYHEWKRLNPGKVIKDMDAKQILHRADLMSVNMTAASNSAWQRGILGVPTQFFGYQARLMEQLLGKRLTPAEKARAFATYSFMYGVPVTAGAFTGVWPWHESFKEYALEKGWDPEGPVKLATEGVPSTLIEMFTGEEFNFSERFGPGGLPILEDIINGDTSMIEALGGVSGTTVFENMKAVSPFLYGVANLLSLKTLDPAWTMTTDDIIEIARTSNTGNSVYNVLTAYALGKYIAKSGTVTDQVQGWESLMGLMGLTPTRISDAYRIIENETTRKEWQKKGMKEAVSEYRKSFDDSLAPQDEVQHWQRTRKIMDKYDLDPQQRRQVVIDAFSRNEGMVRNVTKRAAKNPGPYREYFEKQNQARE